MAGTDDDERYRSMQIKERRIKEKHSRNERARGGHDYLTITRNKTKRWGMNHGCPVLNEARRGAFYSRRDIYDMYSTERRVS